MKIRSDYVSNSSSSSFIIQDAGFFAFFGITVDDIREAILELCGGKEKQDKILAAEIKRCDDKLAEENLDDWSKEYFAQRREELMKDGLKSWAVYDMEDPEERKKCFEEWDSHFESWIAPSEGEKDKWEVFEDIVHWKLDADLDISQLDDGKELQRYDFKTKTRVSLPTGSKEFCRLVKEKLGIKSMKEVLHDESTTLMVHFDDNEVYQINGMNDPGKDDERDWKSDEDNGKCSSSKWDSCSCSKDRFFEILIKHFIDKGKINLADKKFMEYWRVPEDHWWKTDKESPYKGKVYFTDSDDTATWKEVVDDMLNDNSIMHEG